MALLCSFSVASMWFSWCGHHKDEQYSKVDLTIDSYIKQLFCLGAMNFVESSM